MNQKRRAKMKNPELRGGIARVDATSCSPGRSWPGLAVGAALLLARTTVPAETLDLPRDAVIAATTSRVLVFAFEGRRPQPTRLVGDFLFEEFTRTEGPVLVTRAVANHRSVLHRRDGPMLMWNSPGEDEIASTDLVRYVAAAVHST